MVALLTMRDGPKRARDGVSNLRIDLQFSLQVATCPEGNTFCTLPPCMVNLSPYSITHGPIHTSIHDPSPTSPAPT